MAKRYGIGQWNKIPYGWRVSKSLHKGLSRPKQFSRRSALWKDITVQLQKGTQTAKQKSAISSTVLATCGRKLQENILRVAAFGITWYNSCKRIPRVTSTVLRCTRALCKWRVSEAVQIGSSPPRSWVLTVMIWKPHFFQMVLRVSQPFGRPYGSNNLKHLFKLALGWTRTGDLTRMTYWDSEPYKSTRARRSQTTDSGPAALDTTHARQCRFLFALLIGIDARV